MRKSGQLAPKVVAGEVKLIWLNSQMQMLQMNLGLAFQYAAINELKALCLLRHIDDQKVNLRSKQRNLAFPRFAYQRLLHIRDIET